MITATVLFPHDTFGVTIHRGVAYKWADAWNEHLDGLGVRGHRAPASRRSAR